MIMMMMSEYLCGIKVSVYVQVYIQVKTDVNTWPFRVGWVGVGVGVGEKTMYFKSYKAVKNKEWKTKNIN